LFQLIKEAITANQAEAAAYSPAVRAWMALMAVSFLSSVVFICWKAGARWVLAALVVNVLGLILVKAFFPAFTRTEIGTVVHLVFWSIAVIMIWRPGVRVRRRADFRGNWGTLYMVWLIVVSAILCTSLILDARAALNWFI